MRSETEKKIFEKSEQNVLWYKRGAGIGGENDFLFFVVYIIG